MTRDAWNTDCERPVASGAVHRVPRHELPLLEARIVETEGVIDEDVAERRPRELRGPDEAVDLLRVANFVDREQRVRA
jgi:hypothetical protein